MRALIRRIVRGVVVEVIQEHEAERARQARAYVTGWSDGTDTVFYGGQGAKLTGTYR